MDGVVRGEVAAHGKGWVMGPGWRLREPPYLGQTTPWGACRPHGAGAGGPTAQKPTAGCGSHTAPARPGRARPPAPEESGLPERVPRARPNGGLSAPTASSPGSAHGTPRIGAQHVGRGHALPTLGWPTAGTAPPSAGQCPPALR